MGDLRRGVTIFCVTIVCEESMMGHLLLNVYVMKLIPSKLHGMRCELSDVLLLGQNVCAETGPSNKCWVAESWKSRQFDEVSVWSPD